MIALYTLTCGHLVHVTLSSLQATHKRPHTPEQWWCRTCKADQAITGRIR